MQSMINLQTTDQVKIFSDGGARGNPGPAAIGYVVMVGEDVVWEDKNYLGETTNNVAEYEAIKQALGKIVSLPLVPKTIDCFLDSELVVKQLKGEYKIKQAHLALHATQVYQLIKQMKERGCAQISFNYVPRAQNKAADALVNQALDAQAKL